MVAFGDDYSNPPWGLQWRSNTKFIIATVAMGLFTDLFLYGLIVPILPFMLQGRMGVPKDDTQPYVSGLLAAYAGSSCVFSVPAGWVADRTNARRTPFLGGLMALLIATIMFAFGGDMVTLTVARILQGLSAAIVWTVGLAMVLDTVGPEHLGKVVGSIFSIISVGELTAPVLGGLLYEKTGYPGVFGLAGALIVIDFWMRVLVIEKKTAAKYGAKPDSLDNMTEENDNENENGDEEEANEEQPLLSKNEEEAYKIREKPGKIGQTFPILYCFRNPRLIMALLLSFVQATIVAAFDATIPLEAEEMFGFSSMKAGFLFIALDIPYLCLGTVAGWAVDKYGTKPVAVVGFGYLVPALFLLRLPTDHIVHGFKARLALYCIILSLNGVGLAAIGSPSVVEASTVVQKYDKANPGFFGKNGPYAQLYGFNSLMFCAGLAIGPIVSGLLKDAIGYGNMHATISALSFGISVMSYYVIGGKPKEYWQARRLMKPGSEQ